MKKRQRQTLIFWIILVVMIVLIAAALILQMESFAFYNNPTAGFHMKYPQKWTVKENPMEGAAVVFISPKENELDYFQENVNIVVQDLSKKPMNLDEYSNLAITQLIAVFKSNVDMIESKSIFWANKPAHKIVYIGKGDNGARTKLMHIWIIQRTTAYQLTYAAQEAQYDKYIGLVNTMVNSFRLN